MEYVFIVTDIIIQKIRVFVYFNYFGENKKERNKNLFAEQFVFPFDIFFRNMYYIFYSILFLFS